MDDRELGFKIGLQPRSAPQVRGFYDHAGTSCSSSLQPRETLIDAGKPSDSNSDEMPAKREGSLLLNPARISPPVAAQLRRILESTLSKRQQPKLPGGR